MMNKTIPFIKKCPGCEEKNIPIQDKICHICHLKITRYDEIKKQQFNDKEKKLFIALKQIVEQFSSYIIFKKEYTEDSLVANISYHLDFSDYGHDEVAFQNDYPLLFQLFPGEFQQSQQQTLQVQQIICNKNKL